MNYYKVPYVSPINEDALAYAKSTKDWDIYFNFSATQLPPKIIRQDALLDWLNKKYAMAVGIICLAPYVCYDWHVDTRRGVGLNMLLTPDVRSSCLFAKGEGVQFGVEELVYEPNMFYLFNTQNKHMVLNYDKPRYLLTVEFELDKDQLSFYDLLQEIKNPAEAGSRFSVNP
jgi:hypothetical protein